MILRKMTIKRRESGNTFLCGITTFICVILLASCTSSASFFCQEAFASHARSDNTDNRRPNGKCLDGSNYMACKCPLRGLHSRQTEVIRSFELCVDQRRNLQDFQMYLSLAGVSLVSLLDVQGYYLPHLRRKLDTSGAGSRRRSLVPSFPSRSPT